MFAILIRCWHFNCYWCCSTIDLIVHYQNCMVCRCYVLTHVGFCGGVLIKFAYQIYRWSPFTFLLEQTSQHFVNHSPLSRLCRRCDIFFFSSSFCSVAVCLFHSSLHLHRPFIVQTRVLILPYANMLKPYWFCGMKLIFTKSPAHHSLHRKYSKLSKMLATFTFHIVEWHCCATLDMYVCNASPTHTYTEALDSR